MVSAAATVDSAAVSSLTADSIIFKDDLSVGQYFFGLSMLLSENFVSLLPVKRSLDYTRIRWQICIILSSKLKCSLCPAATTDGLIWKIP